MVIFHRHKFLSISDRNIGESCNDTFECLSVVDGSECSQEGLCECPNAEETVHEVLGQQYCAKSKAGEPCADENECLGRFLYIDTKCSRL